MPNPKRQIDLLKSYRPQKKAHTYDAQLNEGEYINLSGAIVLSPRDRYIGTTRTKSDGDIEVQPGEPDNMTMYLSKSTGVVALRMGRSSSNNFQTDTTLGFFGEAGFSTFGNYLSVGVEGARLGPQWGYSYFIDISRFNFYRQVKGRNISYYEYDDGIDINYRSSTSDISKKGYVYAYQMDMGIGASYRPLGPGSTWLITLGGEYSHHFDSDYGDDHRSVLATLQNHVVLSSLFTIGANVSYNTLLEPGCFSKGYVLFDAGVSINVLHLWSMI